MLGLNIALLAVPLNDLMLKRFDRYYLYVICLCHYEMYKPQFRKENNSRVVVYELSSLRKCAILVYTSVSGEIRYQFLLTVDEPVLEC